MKLRLGYNNRRWYQYNAIHLEQARLADLALRWPYLGDRSLLIDLVKSATRDDFGTALELAYRYLVPAFIKSSLSQRRQA